VLEVLPVLVGTLFRSGAIVLVWVRVALGVVGVEALMTRRRRALLQCLSKKQLVANCGETDLNYWALLWWFRVRWMGGKCISGAHERPRGAGTFTPSLDHSGRACSERCALTGIACQ